MLGQAAASGAAGLLSPAAARAGHGTGHGPSKIWREQIGWLSGWSRPLIPPPGAVVVGVQWASPRGGRIEARARRAGGAWGGWVPASSLGHDPDAGALLEAAYGEPLWIGRAAAVQLRSPGSVRDVRLHWVRPGPTRALAAASPPLAQPVLSAGPGQPPIISRRGWAQGQAPPARLAGYGTVQVAFVHHTVNPNGYSAGEVPAMLRAIFDYHRYVRGFFDIAYNFLIDAYGRIWEGRAGGIDMAVIGAHAGAYNTESTGMAVLGDFASAVPSGAAMSALAHLLAWKLSLHGKPVRGTATLVVDPADASYTRFAPGAQVELPRVAGHRDGDLTDCPGDALYGRLPALRRRVASLAGVAARLTLIAPGKPVPAGQTVALRGRLAKLDGTPLAGAPIELQQLHWSPNGSTRVSAPTIVTVQTASDGSWATTLVLQHTTILRAVHRPVPATLADWTPVEVAPVIELSLEASSPIRVSGTVRPPHRSVTVQLYRAQAPHKPIASRRADGLSGSFQAQFPTPAPGHYLVVARTAANQLNAAGASQPVQVTVG